MLLDAWQAGEGVPPRTDVPDTAALDEIARLFDYLPLPLGWIAAALRQKPALPPPGCSTTCADRAWTRPSSD